MFPNFVEINMEEDHLGDRLFANARTDWKAYIGILPRKQQWLFKHYRVHELALVFLSPPLRAAKWLYDKIKY